MDACKYLCEQEFAKARICGGCNRLQQPPRILPLEVFRAWVVAFGAVVLQCCVAVLCCSVVLQCCVAVLCCNVVLQCCVAVLCCSVVLQCCVVT